MDRLQDTHEGAVALAFTAWYNKKHGARYRFAGRDGYDLVFIDGDLRLIAQIASVTYDALNAQFRWMGRLAARDAEKFSRGTEFHRGLRNFINNGLSQKCGQSPKVKCVLILSVHPEVTTAAAMLQLLQEVEVPDNNPFEAIYLIGHYIYPAIGMPALDVRQIS